MNDTKKKTEEKKSSKHTIELSESTFHALDHLKHMFEMMAEDKQDVTYDDVVHVLVQGFAESMQAEEDDGCCGGHCGCHG